LPRTADLEAQTQSGSTPEVSLYTLLNKNKGPGLDTPGPRLLWR